MIRRETIGDVDAIRAVTAAAFHDADHRAPSVEPDGAPGEATLVRWLREDSSWIPQLSLVALEGHDVVGHVVATRADLGGQPALGLGPLSVVPERQKRGVGSALMHAVLAAADALDEPLVALLGDPTYYSRFGFVPARDLGIVAPDETWGDYFQARALTSYAGEAGPFQYAEPFSRL